MPFTGRKEAIGGKDFVFVVEGYEDAIAMHAAGFSNTVALCGTAPDSRTDCIAEKSTRTESVCYWMATSRDGRLPAKYLFIAQSAFGRGTDDLFTGREDPDSLFRRSGKEAFVSPDR